MEVHAHSHTERKKWTHYLWEFLMLFLAVFCGFLAENFREHKVEQDRAKELAASLYKEVHSDSMRIQKSMNGIINIKVKDLHYVVEYIKDSSLMHPSDSFYNSTFEGLLRNFRFEPKDGILTQLRNSGSLRYFKSGVLQEELGNLSVAIAEIRRRNAVEEEFINFTSRPFILKHFDYNWHEATLFEPDKKRPIPQIFNINQFDKQEAINIAIAFATMIRATCEWQYNDYAGINHKLLETLRKEYHLSEEAPLEK